MAMAPITFEQLALAQSGGSVTYGAGTITLSQEVQGWKWATLVLAVDLLTGTNPTVDIAIRQGIKDAAGAFRGMTYVPFGVKDEVESAISQFTVDGTITRLIKIVGTHLEIDVTVGGTATPTAKVEPFLLLRDTNFLGD